MFAPAFPSDACTDRGRAIAQQEPGWHSTPHGRCRRRLPALASRDGAAWIFPDRSYAGVSRRRARRCRAVSQVAEIAPEQTGFCDTTDAELRTGRTQQSVGQARSSALLTQVNVVCLLPGHSSPMETTALSATHSGDTALPSASVVEVRDLTRRFGHVVAVDRVSFSVQRGKAFGLIGANGAGKTTVIRMLTTLLPVTSGTATVAGCDIVRDPAHVRRHIGYVPQLLSADGALTAWENLLHEPQRLYIGGNCRSGQRGDGARRDKGPSSHVCRFSLSSSRFASACPCSELRQEASGIMFR